MLRYTFILHPPPPACTQEHAGGGGERVGEEAVLSEEMTVCRGNSCRRGWRGRFEGRRQQACLRWHQPPPAEAGGNVIWSRRRRRAQMNREGEATLAARHTGDLI